MRKSQHQKTSYSIIVIWLLVLSVLVSCCVNRDDELIPCLDYDEKCTEYQKLGYCQFYFTHLIDVDEDYTERVLYVQKNCQYSCQIPTKALEQRLNFTDSPLTHPFDWGITETPEIIEGVKWLTERIEQVIRSSEVFYLDWIRQQENQNLKVIAETCVDRHPYCGLWTVQGYCEREPHLMSDLCPLLCQACSLLQAPNITKLIYPNFHPKKERKQQHSNKKIYQHRANPFTRNDLQGVLEAVSQNRIYHHVISSIPNSESTDNTVYHRTLQPDYKIPDAHYLRNDKLLLQWDYFVTTSECMAILDIVRYGIGVTSGGTSSKTTSLFVDTEDGFAPSSRDQILYKVEGDEGAQTSKIIRSSSRIHVDPTLPTNMFAPILERVLTKLETFMGISSSYLELPMQFTKFSKNDFQLPMSHYSQGYKALNQNLSSDHPLEGGDDDDITKKTAKVIRNEKNQIIIDDETKTDKQNIKVYTLPDIQQHKEYRMKNGRVFGMILFLGNVKEGGNVTFPNFDNLTIEPQIGRAIIFPTSQDLIGATKTEIDDEEDSTNPLDYSFEDDDRQRYLAEDFDTVFQHDVVTAGDKYILTLYFRRYPNPEDDNDNENNSIKEEENKEDDIAGQFIIDDSEL